MALVRITSLGQYHTARTGYMGAYRFSFFSLARHSSLSPFILVCLLCCPSMPDFAAQLMQCSYSGGAPLYQAHSPNLFAPLIACRTRNCLLYTSDAADE